MARVSPGTTAPTPIDHGAAAIVAACRAAAHRARSEAPTDVASAIAGIGVCSPGPVDPARGVVLEPPNLGPHFRDIPLAAELSSAEDLPAFLDRDTNVAALGERAFGAARDCDDFIYLTDLDRRRRRDRGRRLAVSRAGRARR